MYRLIRRHSRAPFAVQAGARIGLSATDAWDRAAAGDGSSILPFGGAINRDKIIALAEMVAWRMSITTTADTLTADASIDEVKKAIDAGGMR